MAPSPLSALGALGALLDAGQIVRAMGPSRTRPSACATLLSSGSRTPPPPQRRARPRAPLVAPLVLAAPSASFALVYAGLARRRPRLAPRAAGLVILAHAAALLALPTGWLVARAARARADARRPRRRRARRAAGGSAGASALWLGLMLAASSCGARRTVRFAALGSTAVAHCAAAHLLAELTPRALQPVKGVALAAVVFGFAYDAIDFAMPRFLTHGAARAAALLSVTASFRAFMAERRHTLVLLAHSKRFSVHLARRVSRFANESPHSYLSFDLDAACGSRSRLRAKRRGTRFRASSSASRSQARSPSRAWCYTTRWPATAVSKASRASRTSAVKRSSPSTPLSS